MMAYIDKQTVKTIRQTIRKLFPTNNGWKWSVTIMDDNIGITIALMTFPKGYCYPSNLILDYHNTSASCDKFGISGKEKDVLIQVSDVLMEDWWDDSKPLIDYHSIAFYPSLRIGTWNTPALQSMK